MPIRMDRQLARCEAWYAGKGTSLVVVPLLFLLSVCPLRAQIIPSAPPSGEELLKGLNSTEWRARSQALRILVRIPPQEISPQLGEALIDLLTKETQALWNKLQGGDPNAYPPQGEAGEPWAEYYAALLGAVARLNEPAATSALVAAADSPDPRLDAEIARQGAAVIELVTDRLRSLESVQIRLPGFQGIQHGPQRAMMNILAQLLLLNRAKKLPQPLSPADVANICTAARPLLESNDPWVRPLAARTLALAGDAEDIQRIQNTFSRLLDDPDHNVRDMALASMHDLTDRRFLPVADLQRLAQEDDFHFQRSDEVVYPLRSKALRILQNATKGQK